MFSRRDYLLSLKYGLLGYLSSRAMTGYELHKLYPKPMRPTIAFIYRALAAMDREGLVESVRVNQEKRPDRNVFSITEAGLKELDSWLSTPQHFKVPRSTVLVQLWFGSRLDKAAILNDLVAYRDEVKDVLAALSQRRQWGPALTRIGRPRNAEDAYHKLVYESSLAYLKGQIEWMEGIIENIAEFPDGKLGGH
jgi:PadR family transcriptional regulator, regulatory protein AphA